jgi:uncharacterized membrane protein
MVLAGRLHPLLIHFPIALIVVAALAELAATVTRVRKWHVVAVANLRAGATLAVAAAIAGWILASASGIEPSATLEWHRWLGTIAATAAAAAALATVGADGPSERARWIYRIALCGAAACVALTGHLGGILVWGADFLRP